VSDIDLQRESMDSKRGFRRKKRINSMEGKGGQGETGNQVLGSEARTGRARGIDVGDVPKGGKNDQIRSFSPTPMGGFGEPLLLCG